MRLTVPHYYDFGEERRLVGDDLVRPEAWDALRLGTDGPFSLPGTREAWEAMADGFDGFRVRAEAIDRLMNERGVECLASYGAGTAAVELWLHRLSPERRLVLTEYAPGTVERLAAVFPEADVRRHDLLLDDPVAEADLHLFHRIDTEFDNGDLRRVLRRFAGQPVLIVATELIDGKKALSALRTRLRRPRTTRAGWMRNRASFESLWSATHRQTRLELADYHGWLLEPS